MNKTAFFWDERCFWHAGGNYAFTLPIGGLVQPVTNGGLPENPETKRRLKNLMDVTGLSQDLHLVQAPEATWDDLRRIHPEEFLQKFKTLSNQGGGEIGEQTPFAKGGFEIAALSAGLAKAALGAVLRGEYDNAYALSRPPGHHCLPDFPNGFCLLANIAIAIEAAQAQKLAQRVVVLDWDVHHGNGTEHIYYRRDDVLTISLHQDRNYPTTTGGIDDRGAGAGLGYNMNIPLPPGGGHALYLDAMERLVIPAITAFDPNVIIVATGYDAAAVDPLSRMMATAQTFRAMSERVMSAAQKLCEGKLVMVHEGGYSETYVPFCGHQVLEQLCASDKHAPDPLADELMARQPCPRLQAAHQGFIDDMQAFFFGG